MSVFTTYKVQSGDTLYGISRKFGMGVDELKAVNGLKSNNLSLGQVIKVRSNIKTPTPVPPAVPATPSQSSTSAGGNLSTYQVKAGDTLYGICTKFKMSVEEIKSINGLPNNNLKVGQILKVRSVGGGTAPAPVTPTAPPIFTPGPVNPPSTQMPDNYFAARQLFSYEIRPDAGFTRFLLKVPLLNGGQIIANLRDNVTHSPYMVYPQGIVYGGQSSIELDVDTIESVGLTANQAKALQYVSTHEGKFDAINSYDKAIFSYGFIQFTGGAAVGASLNRVLGSMKAYAPAAFQRVFQRVGIDSEGTGNLTTTTVLTENGTKLRNDDAWLYIQRNLHLYGAFIQAGYEPTLVREQLRMANILYVQAALNFKLDVTLGGIRIVVPRISDVITSEAALTVVIALAVNQGVGGMSRILATSVGTVASQTGLTTAQTLPRIDEWQVVQHMAQTSTDERVRARAVGVLQSGLSFVKV